MPTPGLVSLVGAGPGAPGLLTLDGARRLASADVVLYDYLASEALLDHTREGVRLVCLGRHGEGKLWKQQEINERMVAESLAGHHVVRLKGGDPGVFGRLAEEIAACCEAGVPFEVIPGVTTAVAAGAFAGVTITDRDRASCVAFVTGHERQGKQESEALDFGLLAKFPGTLVVYMGVTNAPEWSRKLIAGGKPADTPVLLVRRCSLPDQSMIDCTLGELPEVLAPQRVRPPLVAIIGQVAQREEAAQWFTGRPLFGQTVLVTRPSAQAKPTAQRLADLGARVLLQPVIETTDPKDLAAVDDAIGRLGDFDWLAFSSRNGIDFFLRRLHQLGHDARALGRVKLAAIGPATADALADWRLNTDLTPEEYRAEALAERLQAEASGKRVLLVRASRGREVLAEQLTAAGSQVEQVVAYQSEDVAAADDAILEEIAAGRVDWITVTSSAIARSVVRLFGDAIATAPTPPKLAAISPLTAEALLGEGAAAGCVAETYTSDGLIDAIVKARRGESG